MWILNVITWIPSGHCLDTMWMPFRCCIQIAIKSSFVMLLSIILHTFQISLQFCKTSESQIETIMSSVLRCESFVFVESHCIQHVATHMIMPFHIYHFIVTKMKRYYKLYSSQLVIILTY